MNNMTMLHEAALGQPQHRPDWDCNLATFDFGQGITGDLISPSAYGSWNYVVCLSNGIGAEAKIFEQLGDALDWLCDQARRELTNALRY